LLLRRMTNQNMALLRHKPQHWSLVGCSPAKVIMGWPTAGGWSSLFRKVTLRYNVELSLHMQHRLYKCSYRSPGVQSLPMDNRKLATTAQTELHVRESKAAPAVTHTGVGSHLVLQGIQSLIRSAVQAVNQDGRQDDDVRFHAVGVQFDLQS
jgi:hypothetical protein